MSTNIFPHITMMKNLFENQPGFKLIDSYLIGTSGDDRIEIKVYQEEEQHYYVYYEKERMAFSPDDIHQISGILNFLQTEWKNSIKKGERGTSHKIVRLS